MKILTLDKIIEIFCIVDNFCREYSKFIKNTKCCSAMVNGAETVHVTCPTAKL